MSGQTIRFEDGEAYEHAMGGWSRLAGAIFLDWVAPEPGLHWADIGCGNGVFTEMLLTRAQAASAHGIDPSAGQLRFARQRPGIQHAGMQRATFTEGDAQALPFDDNAFDAATMALVIFFVPNPARGVAEMARIVRPGGLVGAYAWDFATGGFPFHPIQEELRAMGYTPPLPPSVEAGRAEVMHALWTDAGLRDVETRQIRVTRSFPDFEAFWRSSTNSGSVKPISTQLGPERFGELKERLRRRMPVDAEGRVAYESWANAVKGRV